MSLGEQLFVDFVKHLYEAFMGEEEKAVYQCELPSLGNSNLHELAKKYNSEDLRKFLKVFKQPVDIVDPESGVTPLVVACKIGNLKSVRLLVERGANVNHSCSGFTRTHRMKYDKVTPIYVAAAEGNEFIVEYLANHGADVNARMSPLGLTPLHRAVVGKDEDTVKLLVKKFKAKVSIPSVETPCSYPIHNAIVVQDHEILTILLDAEDADPNIADATEQVTPIHFAAYKGDVKATEILISKGANVNAQLKSGHAPLDLAIQEKNRHVVECLKAHGAQRKVLDKSWHPLASCVKSGLHSLKAAINRGADVNSLISPKDGTALHFCVASRKMDACKFLIRKGADLESRDIYGRTPLHVATERNLIHAIEFLLEKGANINSQTDNGFTPLHRAAIEGHYALCKLLLDKGADMEAMAHELGPPIMGAIHQSNTSIVKLLLKHGANPNAMNPVTSSDHVNLLQIAIQFAAKKPEIIKALIEAGADVRAPVVTHHGTLSFLHILPLVTDNAETLKFMIEAGAFLDTQAIQTNNEPFGCVHVNGPRGDQCMAVRYHGTPLQAVKKDGRPQLVRLLEATDNLFKAVRKDNLSQVKKYVAEGGLVNCCSVRYDTPLIYASWKGFVGIVKFLLANGAKIDMPNVQNSSPLHYAAKYNQKEVVIELLKAGAPVNLVKSNKTPLELAQEHGHSDIIAVLEFTKKYLDVSRNKKVTPVPEWKSDAKITSLASEFDGKVSENDLQAFFE